MNKNTRCLSISKGRDAQRLPNGKNPADQMGNRLASLLVPKASVGESEDTVARPASTWLPHPSKYRKRKCRFAGDIPASPSPQGCRQEKGEVIRKAR